MPYWELEETFNTNLPLGLLAFGEEFKQNKQGRLTDMKIVMHLVHTLLLVDQSLDPQDGRAEGDTELQDRQDDEHSVDASQNHLVGRKNSLYCNSCVN